MNRGHKLRRDTIKSPLQPDGMRGLILHVTGPGALGVCVLQEAGCSRSSMRRGQFLGGSHGHENEKCPLYTAVCPHIETWLSLGEFNQISYLVPYR